MTALLALPGTLCPPAVYDALVAALDVPPHGIDWMTGPGPWDVPTLATAVLAAADEPVVLLGHSTGGAIAQQAAVDQPDRVAGILLIGTGAHMRGHGDVDAILDRIQHAWGEPLHAGVLDRSFRGPLDPATRRRWLDWAAGVPQRAAYEVLASQRDLDLRPRLAEVRCPVTVVHGRHDAARPVRFAEELVAGLPHARLRLLDTGHTAQHEAPAEVAVEVRALLERVAQASGSCSTPTGQSAG